MEYDDGRPVIIGDKLRLWDEMNGRIVCNFDTLEYLDGFSSDDWSSEKTGVIIMSDTGELDTHINAFCRADYGVTRASGASLAT